MSRTPLEILKSQPSYEELEACLESWTQRRVSAKTAVQDALFTRTLVVETIPNFWTLAQTAPKLKHLLLHSLASIPGISALLEPQSRLRHLRVLQDVLVLDVLNPVAVLNGIRRLEPDAADSGSLSPSSQQLWYKFLSLVVSGKIIGLVAEVTQRSSSEYSQSEVWVDDRERYVLHLMKQLNSGLKSLSNEPNSTWHYLGQYLDRIASLGDHSQVTRALLHDKFTANNELEKVSRLLQCCSPNVQSQSYLSLARYAETSFLRITSSRESPRNLHRDQDRIGAVGRLFAILTQDRAQIHYSQLLLHFSSAFSLSLRRAIIAAYPKDSLDDMAQTCMTRWARADYIKRAVVLEQEALTETILVLCAYLPIEQLTALSKSRALMEGITHHLESTADRVRFLGMIVGETISARVIAEEKARLTFGVPETQTPESHWWRALMACKDELTDLSDLTAGVVDMPDDSPPSRQNDEKAVPAMEHIDEAAEEEDSSDGEFPTMRVPDSDDEDSDEDPSLVDREKLHPPVYIRDLIGMFNNHDSYKHILLALRTAPSLIRRKAEYGTELADYAIALTQIIAGLRDNFDIDAFQELRQEALKALVVSAPKEVCPYLSHALFTGDYSLQQRVVMLSAIGLGARELAGASGVDARFQHLTVSAVLPERLLQQYPATLQGASAQVQRAIMQPMADEAAESLAGPAALKVDRVTRRFTAPRQVTVINKLTALSAECILLPLLHRFAMHGGKMIASDAQTFYEATLLMYYLRTVLLVFRESAASPALSRLTSEFWPLLLSLRTHQDHGVIEAILQSCLVLLDTNDDRRLALECARYMIETQEWCTAVFDGIKEEKIRMLSAGVLHRIRDVTEANQVLMMHNQALMANLGQRGKFGLLGLH